MRHRVLALLALGCSAILLTSCGQAKGTKAFDDHRIARFSGGSFAWSPDGRRFAYTSDRGGHHDLLVVDADGSGRRRLSDDASGARTVGWSPDSRRIAYVSPHGRHSDLLVVDADGSGKQRLSHDASGSPRWSPDGGRILFLTERGLSVVNADGSGERRLTRDPAHYLDHSWSPDGRSIVYASAPLPGSNAPHISSIHLVNVDGTGRRRLTRSESANSPVWSSDGDRIAFVRQRFGAWADILVVDADGTHERQLTSGRHRNSSPEWAPDGRTIVFETEPPKYAPRSCVWGAPDCAVSVTVVDADRAGQRRLTSEGTSSIAPVWSPDGRRIAFFRRTASWFAVVVMNADGTDKHRVTRNRKGRPGVLWWPRGDMLAFAAVDLTRDRPGRYQPSFDIVVVPVE